MPLENADIPEFKREIQLAFQRGYEAEFGRNEKQVLPEKDIDGSLDGKGAYAYTAGRNKKVIAEYIRNQLMEDLAEDKLTHPELFDPFTGEDRRKK